MGALDLLFDSMNMHFATSDDIENFHQFFVFIITNRWTTDRNRLKEPF